MSGDIVFAPGDKSIVQVERVCALSALGARKCSDFFWLTWKLIARSKNNGTYTVRHLKDGSQMPLSTNTLPALSVGGSCDLQGPSFTTIKQEQHICLQ